MDVFEEPDTRPLDELLSVKWPMVGLCSDLKAKFRVNLS